MDNVILTEAFKELKLLDEEAFDMNSAEEIEDAKDFLNDDADSVVEIADVYADEEGELLDSYVGKVILECEVCHSKIFEDADKVAIDENEEVVNMDEECPFCFSNDGYKVIGQVAPFGQVEEEIEVTEEEPVDDIETEEEIVEESFKRKRKGKKINESKRRRKNRKINESAEDDDDDGLDYSEDDLEQIVFDLQDIGFECWSKEDIEDMAEYISDHYENFPNLTAGKLADAMLDAGWEMDFLEDEFDESLNESADISEYQKWVDFDMEKYGRISNITMKKIKKAGFSVVKDQYGDYEVIADRRDESLAEGCHKKGNTKNQALEECGDVVTEEACPKCGKHPCECEKDLEEDFKDVSITTDDSHMTMTSDDEGKVTVTTEPIHDEFEDDFMADDISNGDEMITPVDDETVAEIKDEIEEEPFEDEEDIDIDIDEFDEEGFDELGESYLKKVYENVNSFKTTGVRESKNKLCVEGLIKFASGNKKKTSFIFEAKDVDAKGKIRFIGENKEITRGKKSFTVVGRMDGKKFMCESFNYNYHAKDENGKSTRLYGTIRK